MPTARSVIIAIYNASTVDVAVNYGQLTGGNWDGNSLPIPGTVLSAGANSFVNGADTVVTTLGGMIALSPASGGAITVTWSWPFGSGVNGATAGDSLTGLAIASTVVNTQTANPQLTVHISDSASLTAAMGLVPN